MIMSVCKKNDYVKKIYIYIHRTTNRIPRDLKGFGGKTAEGLLPRYAHEGQKIQDAIGRYPTHLLPLFV